MFSEKEMFSTIQIKSNQINCPVRSWAHCSNGTVIQLKVTNLIGKLSSYLSSYASQKNNYFYRTGILWSILGFCNNRKISWLWGWKTKIKIKNTVWKIVYLATFAPTSCGQREICLPQIPNHFHKHHPFYPEKCYLQSLILFHKNWPSLSCLLGELMGYPPSHFLLSNQSEATCTGMTSVQGYAQSYLAEISM